MFRQGTRHLALISLVPLALAACAVDPSEGVDSQGSAVDESLCGNGVRDPGEQCDDGNHTNLDGCDKECRFEQVQRLNRIDMMFNTDSYCSSNALGGAIGSAAQSQIQDAVNTSVNDGSISVLLAFLGLTDLSGQSAPSFTMGSVVGDPTGPNALDAWYTVNSSSVDADRNPAATLPGAITNGALSVGPGNLAFALNLGGTSPTNVRLSNGKVRAQVGASSVPTVSSAGSSPGHLTSEQLDPALSSFATMTNGQACGNVSAATLAAIPAPAPLISGGSTSCSQGYTAANSLLDVFVGGCRVFIVTALSATQPDKADPSAPAAGAGAPYKLVAGSNRKVSGCKDRSGASVPLEQCLESAAYSAAFKFTTQRAIAR